MSTYLAFRWILCRLINKQPIKQWIVKAKNLYDEVYYVYIKARCAAEMSKKLIYEIDVSLDKNSAILECQIYQWFLCMYFNQSLNKITHGTFICFASNFQNIY